MKFTSIARRIVVPIATAAIAVLFTLVAHSDDTGKKDQPQSGNVKFARIFEHSLPKADFHKVSVLTVSYGPGGASPKHRHDVAVFAYVLEGEIESKLEGEPLKRYQTGEMWYEPPGTIHEIGRNASME